MKMAYTGYKIIQYIDDNPKSSGYGQTWTERVLDTSNCPSGDSSWNLISSSCEATTSGYTGRRINIYYNNVTGEYSSTTKTDSGCTASSSEENWVNSGDTYCEQDENGIYTGWGIQLQVQRNSNLINYGEVREVRFSSTTCSDETNPDWETISTNCKVVADMLTCRLYFDGTADILQIDINPSSPTFNQTRTITGFSEDCVCEACDSVEESWSYIADYCGNQMPSEYQLSGLTDDTVYHVYRMYETCIIDGQSGRTRPTNVYSAETYQTGVSGCTYRWVDTGEVECVEDGPQSEFRWVTVEGEYTCSGTTKMTREKQQVSTDSGTTWTDTGFYRAGAVIEYNSDDCGYVPQLKFEANYSGGQFYFSYCDSSSTLTTTDTMPSDYNYKAMTDAQIMYCVNEIGNRAFGWFGSLSSVTIPSSVITIGDQAFIYCSGLTMVNSREIGECIIPDGVTSIGVQAFARCESLTYAEIPNSVTTIGMYAFNNSRCLHSVRIGTGVTSIGSSAFEDCQTLTSVKIYASTPPTLGSRVFIGTSNSFKIYVNPNYVDTYKRAWSEYASIILPMY